MGLNGRELISGVCIAIKIHRIIDVGELFAGKNASVRLANEQNEFVNCKSHPSG